MYKGVLFKSPPPLPLGLFPLNRPDIDSTFAIKVGHRTFVYHHQPSPALQLLNILKQKKDSQLSLCFNALFELWAQLVLVELCSPSACSAYTATIHPHPHSPPGSRKGKQTPPQFTERRSYTYFYKNSLYRFIYKLYFASSN